MKKYVRKYGRMTKKDIREKAMYMTYSYMNSIGRDTINSEKYEKLVRSFEQQIYREYIRTQFSAIDETFTRMNECDHSRDMTDNECDSYTAYEAAEERAIWRYEEETSKSVEYVLWSQEERDDYWERILEWEMRNIR